MFHRDERTHRAREEDNARSRPTLFTHTMSVYTSVHVLYNH